MFNDWVECVHCEGTGTERYYVNEYSYGEFPEKVQFEVECYYCKGVGEVFQE